ncbi:hypothetical protein F7725_003723 [Dissostichus mawsoni]|uniref:ENTH domain-containing protein n=1 Tax=Dissostichus mawsoni TaxID=36200 RepID=A0A7J5YB52_DISMA|nr:hypothetical protein F7725_003723 [Dissostichus mawsoni]
MPSSTIRRQMKNMVNNYSDAEKKVRESTSNDPWGPSSSLMSEIADLTYNVVAFSEIMSMIWKRLNDHGKNWRHVYKALTLLDYLIKTGSERVALQCKENIFAIQTLKDFQFIDRDGKDQGINVREKSKQLVVLLKDEERLKGERSQALKTKERMAQVSTGSSQMGFGRGSSQPNLSTSYSEEYGRSEGSPASYHGLMLTCLLNEDRIRRGDDLRLQMALEESKKGGPDSGKLAKRKKEPQSSLMDLMVVPEPGATADPWGAGATAGARAAAAPEDPWKTYASSSSGPMGATPSVPPMKSSDPWAANSAPAADPWSSATRPKNSITGQPGEQQQSGPLRPPPSSMSMSGSTNPTRKTPESFLGPNAALVNLDSLVTKPAQPAPVVNPFLASAGVAAPALAQAAHANPFQVTQPVPPPSTRCGSAQCPPASGWGTPCPSPGVRPAHHHGPHGTRGGWWGAARGNAGLHVSAPAPDEHAPQAGLQQAGTTNPFLLPTHCLGSRYHSVTSLVWSLPVNLDLLSPSPPNLHVNFDLSGSRD